MKLQDEVETKVPYGRVVGCRSNKTVAYDSGSPEEGYIRVCSWSPDGATELGIALTEDAYNSEYFWCPDRATAVGLALIQMAAAMRSLQAEPRGHAV